MSSKLRILRYLPILALLVFVQAALADREVALHSGSRIDILFIGNSYTYYNDLPQLFRSVAAANRHLDLHVAAVVEGGASLRSHWNENTLELIRRGEWEYVVLQEQSLAPLEARDQFMSYGKRLADEIRGASAQPVLYLTWPRQQRPEDQALLNEAYVELARETQALIVPVGPVWQQLRGTDGIPGLYAEDGSHPSPFGSFVAALTFHRALIGAVPPDTSGLAHGVSREMMATVWGAVEGVNRLFAEQ